jgi:acyl-CoA thioesterase I
LIGIFLAAPAQAAPQTLVALGDSLTQGYGLPVEDGLVPQLEAWLQERGLDVALINAGVSGDTTAGGLARTDWALVPEASAVMVLLGGNDVLRGLPPAEARANLDAILDKIAARNLPVLLVPITAPGNYGPEYKASFDAIFPELAAKHHALLAAPYLDAILAGTDQATALGSFFQADGIHPNKAGVARAIEVLGPKVFELLGQAEN